jgi:hypothetical protein
LPRWVRTFRMQQARRSEEKGSAREHCSLFRERLSCVGAGSLSEHDALNQIREVSTRMMSSWGRMLCNCVRDGF